jgi:hypothetical protein
LSSSVTATRPKNSDSAALVACAVAAFAPAWFSYLRDLWALPPYHFVPLLIGATMVIALRRSRRQSESVEREPCWSAIALSLATAGLVLSVVLQIPEIGAAASLLFLLAVWLRFSPTPVRKSDMFAWLLLWVAIRPPWDLDLRALSWLHAKTIEWAHRALDALGMLHTVRDSTIEVPSGFVLPTESPLGWPWIVAILTAVVWYCCWRRRTLLETTIVTAAAAFWLFSLLVARVVVGAWMLEVNEIDLDAGALGKCVDVGWALVFALLVLALESIFQGRRKRRRRVETPPFPTAKSPTQGLQLAPDGTLSRLAPRRHVDRRPRIFAACFVALLAWQLLAQIWSA